MALRSPSRLLLAVVRKSPTRAAVSPLINTTTSRSSFVTYFPARGASSSSSSTPGRFPNTRLVCAPLSTAAATTNGSHGSSTSLPRTFEEMEQTDAEAAGLARSARRVGSMLGDAMRRHARDGDALLATVEKLRRLARTWRAARSEGDDVAADEKFKEMVDEVGSLSNHALRDAARAFAQFLALLNAAEQEYRIRRLEATRDGPLFPGKEDSVAGTVRVLLEDEGESKADVLKALSSQQVEIVLTAHPTEVHRRTLLTKHRRATQLLAKLEDGHLEKMKHVGDHSEIGTTLNNADPGEPVGTPPPLVEEDYASEELSRELRSVVHGLWGSDDVRRAKPTPQKEARGGLAFIETSLWDAVPAFLRRLDSVARDELDAPPTGLPLTAAPIKLASWMGGDRDGNPNVTSDVTREVVAAQRRKGAAMFLGCLDALRLDVSVRHATDEFREHLGKDHRDAKEPYKELFDQLAARLRATVNWADAELDKCKAAREGGGSSEARSNSISKERLPSDSLALRVADLTPEDAVGEYFDADHYEPIFDSREFLDLLIEAHASLRALGYDDLAEGRLKDTIRRVACFGLQLAPLDVRQESTKHRNAVDAIRAATGKYAEGSYLAMSETEKIQWLSDELRADRPLLRRSAFERLFSTKKTSSSTSDAQLTKLDALLNDPVDRDVLATCAYVATAPEGTFGAYVISQAQSAADVLAVELLLAEAGVEKKPRIVPLFETLDDLNNAPMQLEQLFKAPGYLNRVGHVQEIMVGYSDSAKDAGRLAASWAQYEAQEKMLAVARKFNVQVTFFHGKGGTVGRGGNPQTYEAILAHPPETIQGRFRVTEQGEMIAFNLGEPQVAERTCDCFTAGILRDFFRKATDAKCVVRPEWRDAMRAISDASCAEYRGVVRERPDFVPYFRAATPELELSALNVGSRPAKRNPKGGVESLRAIPWIFSWTQTRLNLPAWLGVATLSGRKNDDTNGADPNVLADMYANFRWFKTNVDLIESLLARTEPGIAAYYDANLVDDPALLTLGADLRERLDDTVSSVLGLTGRPYPASDNFLLQRALTLRNPYVDVLNVIQVEALKKRRALDNPDEDPDLNDALLISINGIAAGLRNSG